MRRSAYLGARLGRSLTVLDAFCALRISVRRVTRRNTQAQFSLLSRLYGNDGRDTPAFHAYLFHYALGEL